MPGLKVYLVCRKKFTANTVLAPDTDARSKAVLCLQVPTTPTVQHCHLNVIKFSRKLWNSISLFILRI